MFNKVILFLLIISIVFVLTPTKKIAAQTNELQEIDISISPIEVLFDVKNMKPGDFATRELTVINNGTEDFNYTSSVHLSSGSKKLFDELILVVKDEEKELFKGKLSEFKGFTSRSLSSSTNEKLTFTVEFPAHLGNEFQGLFSEVELKFYVAGTLGGLLPVNGPRLPETGTFLFNLLILGGTLFVSGLLMNLILVKRKVML